MEFTNDIFFDKPLIAGNTVILTYFGKLYREHSKDVSIVFGYGDNWDETDNAPMHETENGFEVTLTIKDYNTFNFCFTNSFNIWDNNSGFNYIAAISPKQEQQSNDDDTPKADGLGDSFEEAGASSVTEEPEENTEENEETQESEENTTEAEPGVDTNSENFESKEIEAAFSSLLDSILEDNNKNETVDISNLSGFGLQSVDEIKEEDIVNCDKIFSELFGELTADTEEPVKQNIELEEKEVREAELIDYDKYDAQELDSLMDNLLTSISDDFETADYATPIQEIETQDLSEENVGLPAVKEKEDWIDKIVNVSYSFSRKIINAFKKLGSFVKSKSTEFGENK